MRLAQRLGIPRLSTGDMLRAAVAASSDLGNRVEETMALGGLVSDELIVDAVADRLKAADACNGFILDGFPRTIQQAEALDRLCVERGLRIDVVLEIRVDEGALAGRISRRAQEAAQRGEPVRSDDNPEVLRSRLEAYRQQTAPLIEYYDRQRLLRSVDGLQSIEAVSERLIDAINAMA